MQQPFLHINMFTHIKEVFYCLHSHNKKYNELARQNGWNKTPKSLEKLMWNVKHLRSVWKTGEHA